MTDAELRREMLAETFDEETQRIIDGVVKRWYYTVGGDLEEMESEAQELFIHAFDSYDPTKGSWQQWLRWQVGFGLKTAYRLRHSRNEYIKRVEAELDDFPTQQMTGFNLTELLETLGGDARVVVEMVCGSLTEIPVEAARSRYLRALKKRLLGMGWDWTRIVEALAEIRTAL